LRHELTGTHTDDVIKIFRIRIRLIEQAFEAEFLSRAFSIFVASDVIGALRSVLDRGPSNFAVREGGVITFSQFLSGVTWK
jgi:hypothetical protein